MVTFVGVKAMLTGIAFMLHVGWISPDGNAHTLLVQVPNSAFGSSCEMVGHSVEDALKAAEAVKDDAITWGCDKVART